MNVRDGTRHRVACLSWWGEVGTALQEASRGEVIAVARRAGRAAVYLRSGALRVIDLEACEIPMTIDLRPLERALCLIQVAGRDATFLIDALEVAELEPLGPLLASSGTIKAIHHASFEREVLGRHGLSLEAVVDTVERSRRLRETVGGHSLREVCARELGVAIDKGEQASDWTRRPLSESQVTYAALDAEVLLHLHMHFERVARGEGDDDA